MIVAFSYSSSVNSHFKPLLGSKIDIIGVGLLSFMCYRLCSHLRASSVKEVLSYKLYRAQIIPSLAIIVACITLSLSILIKILPSHEGPLKM